jgi:ADP-heptose:LPS heptosyltransferase
MASVLISSIHRIAVFRALQLGDLLCAVPALRALRNAFPLAEITLIGLPWARDFVGRFNRYLDAFLEFPGYPGLPERPIHLAAIPSFFEQAQQQRFDLLIQMHGNGTITNPLAMLVGARQIAGYFQAGAYCPAQTTFFPYPEGQPEIWRHLKLMELLGIPVHGSGLGEELEFPVSPEDAEALKALEHTVGLRPPYICFHPGGRGKARRWPADRFAHVADQLTSEALQIVITGTAEEAALAAEMEQRMRRTAVNLVGRTDLGILGALLQRARLLVSNDTGVSHVAAALRVPSVIICMGSDPVRWGPLNRERHRVLMGETATVQSVAHEAETLLGKAGSLAA